MSVNQHYIFNKLAIGSPVIDNDLTLSINGTDGMLLPGGSTANRPTGSSLVESVLRYNSALKKPEWYDGTQWLTIPDGTVTNFSSGNLATVFSTVVTNSSTTPTQSFILYPQSPNTFFAGPDGVTGTPIWRPITLADLPTVAGQNFVTANLSATANRVHDFNSFDLSIIDIDTLTLQGVSMSIDSTDINFPSITNDPTQNRLLGHSSVDGSVGWIQLGSTLSLSSGTLSVNGNSYIQNQFTGQQTANFLISGIGQGQEFRVNYDDFISLPSSSGVDRIVTIGTVTNLQGFTRSAFIQSSGQGRPPVLINPNGNGVVIGTQVSSNGYSYQRMVFDENATSITDAVKGTFDLYNITLTSRRDDGDIGIDMYEALLKLGTITDEGASPYDGCIYYDSTNDLFRGRKNGVWRTFLMDDYGGGGGGEANTASNLGSGTGLFAAKVGVDLRFKSLIAGTGISLSNDANTVTITNSSPDQTVSLTNGSGISVTGTYPSFTIASTITQYTDELAQDAIGGILVDTSTINFTYNDGTPSIVADVIADSSVQKVAVRKNSTGGDIGTRRRINFIEGSNVTITIADDGVDNELDVTIASSGGASGYATVQEEGSSLTQRSVINFIGGGITAADDAGNTRTNVTLDADLSAIAALSGTGLARRTGTDTWTLDTNTYLTENIYNANGTLTANRTVSGGGTTSLTFNNLTTFSAVGSSIVSLQSTGSNVALTAGGNVVLSGNNVNLQATAGSGSTTIGGGVVYIDALSPSQITSNQNDYSPTNFLGSYLIRLSSDAARDITGLGLISSNNKVYTLLNVGSFNITLKNENASSSPTGRFSLNGDIVLAPNDSIEIIYDPTTQRWRQIGISSGITKSGTDLNLNQNTISNFAAAINAQTGTTYTILASDMGKVITCSNASAITVTVPSGLPAGFTCTVIQLGAGQVTFSASGTTVNNRQSHTKIAGQYGVASLAMYTSDTFVLGGDTAA